MVEILFKKKSFTRFALQSECCNFNQWEHSNLKQVMWFITRFILTNSNWTPPKLQPPYFRRPCMGANTYTNWWKTLARLDGHKEWRRLQVYNFYFIYSVYFAQFSFFTEYCQSALELCSLKSKVPKSVRDLLIFYFL